MLHKVNIDITVSSVESASLRALRFIRYHDGEQAQRAIGKFYLVAEGKAEIKELPAGEDFRLINTKYKKPAFNNRCRKEFPRL